MYGRLPLTQHILARLINALDKTVVAIRLRTMLKAMFAVSFYGLLRIGEVTKTTKNRTTIQLNQLTYVQGCFIINITNFKHNVAARPVDIEKKQRQWTYQ